MKKFLGIAMCLVLLAGASVPALAQNPGGRYARRTTQDRRDENSHRVYNDRRDRSLWDRSRDKLTVAAGTGAGAAIGGLAGGKKGAIIGALLGAGGSALYTYKLRDRNQGRYYRRR